jgi:endo-1,4-beta-xylanase
MTTMRAEHGTTRRKLLTLVAGGLCAAKTGFAAAAEPGLASIAEGTGVSFGAAGSEEQFADDAYRDLFLSQVAVFTPENALKFGSLQPQQGRFTFASADALVDFGLQNGLLVRGHNLFWNDYPPAWLKTLSGREIEAVFDRYIETVVPHFAGRLHSWDVVNEPFWLGRDRPGAFRPGPWYDAMGDEYIFRAFRRVAGLDRQARLVLNEAWTERTDMVGLAVRRALLTLIDRIQQRGLKLDAIGLQGHLMPQEPYDDGSFVDFLHQIAARGLDIYITEFDVDDRSFADDPAQRDAKVAARAGAFLSAALKVSAIKMVVCWGLTDRYTWWRDPSMRQFYKSNRLPRPLPYDDELRKKPMWEAMAEAFRSRR